MSTSLEQRLSALHDSLHHHDVGRLGRTYPVDVRAEATELACDLRQQGKSWRATSQAVGIGVTTLQRWLGHTPVPSPGHRRRRRRRPRKTEAGTPGPSLRLVEVVDDLASASSNDAGLVAVSPSGWRIEGLTLEQLARIMHSAP